jgi:hypothetical protein
MHAEAVARLYRPEAGRAAQGEFGALIYRPRA